VTQTPGIPNVLAGRYASTAMTGVWSPEAKIVMERRLWLAVAAAQVSLGLDIPPAALEDYRRVTRRSRAVVEKVFYA